MSKNNELPKSDLRWIETPKGRAIINAVALTLLLTLTQHFGYIEPGPPVTFDSFSLFAAYGLIVGVIMYFWTDFRLKRRRRKLAEEAQELSGGQRPPGINGDVKSGSDEERRDS